VREARVRVEINGQPIELTSATYHLPVTVAGVQVDCPVTRGYLAHSTADHWGLVKAARLRLWPAGSPWVARGTLVYPVRQRWFAGATQMANEPTFVDGLEQPSRRAIYYHAGLDIGGAEGLIEVVAAAAGLVVSSGKAALPGYEDTPVKPRYDVVYVLDDQGWYYRYSHLHTIDPSIKPGATVTLGQKLGLLGKEGDSGGWSHLHFEIISRQPSGKWGTQEGYAFLWEAAIAAAQPALVAVARPHHLAFVHGRVALDGSRSWSRRGRLARYEWFFQDGTTAFGARVDRTYSVPGEYSEIFKVTDDLGNVAYDFATVQVLDRRSPEPVPPAIHAAFAPTENVLPGDRVTFKVRTFGTTDGGETWDFGDGSPAVQTHSDGNIEAHARDGYAGIVHRYSRPGDYLVRVERANRLGQKATARLLVTIQQTK
jgi:murein DD-endopeptidase MepM/ murein hydrolase activator NlpD